MIFLINTERKEEEKEDLWKLWNEVRQDGDQAAPLLSKNSANNRITSDLNDKNALLKRGTGQTVGKSNLGTSTVSAMHKQAPLSSISRPALTFELDNGKFAAPNGGAPSTRTYTYNNNTYNVHSTNKNNSSLMTSTHSPGTPLRFVLSV